MEPLPPRRSKACAGEGPWSSHTQCGWGPWSLTELRAGARLRTATMPPPPPLAPRPPLRKDHPSGRATCSSALSGATAETKTTAGAYSKHLMLLCFLLHLLLAASCLANWLESHPAGLLYPSQPALPLIPSFPSKLLEELSTFMLPLPCSHWLLNPMPSVPTKFDHGLYVRKPTC